MKATEIRQVKQTHTIFTTLGELLDEIELQGFGSGHSNYAKSDLSNDICLTVTVEPDPEEVRAVAEVVQAEYDEANGVTK